MEKLAEELSKLFNVSTSTIENIIHHYPKLRGQMIIYNILNEISGLALAVIFTILVVNVYLYVCANTLRCFELNNRKN